MIKQSKTLRNTFLDGYRELRNAHVTEIAASGSFRVDSHENHARVRFKILSRGKINCP